MLVTRETNAARTPLQYREHRRKGFARIAEQPLLEPEQVVRALSGHVTGQLILDREKLASLRLLGEYYGLWGTGRKPPKSSDDEVKPREFSMETVDPQERGR